MNSARFASTSDVGLRPRLLALTACLIGANIATWIWAFSAFSDQPALLGAAMLAYTLGLRHAVDADHIAAIDNSVRKLMQQGQRPLCVGLFFSLGHSTVVVLLSLAVGFASAGVVARFEGLKEVGGLIGASVSAGFLLLLALVNVIAFVSVYRAFRAVRAGAPYVEDDFDYLLNGRGFLARLFRPLFGFVGKSWHLYPVGFLFGLGFDTATEVALLGMSATQAAQGISFVDLLAFPALFTAGMTLLDTADGVLMLGAYGWAFVRPIRKLYYNLTITAVSVVIALLIGGVEALGLIGGRLGLQGGFWRAIEALNANLGVFGYVIVAIFVASWLVSFAVYRLKGFDELEIPRAGRA